MDKWEEKGGDSIPMDVHIPDDLKFEDLFDLDEIQKIQDEFSRTVGLSTAITRLDGTPITDASQSQRFCMKVVRSRAAGVAACYHSDAELGKRALEKPFIQRCLSAGLWDAATAIKVQDKPIAFWLIGQVRDETQTEEDIRSYAREIGVDENVAVGAFREIPFMHQEEFRHIVDLLALMANQLSTIAYKNYIQKQYLLRDKALIEDLKSNEAYLNTLINTIPDLLWLKDPEGRYLYCNHRIEDLYGRTGEEIIGGKDLDFVDEKTARGFRINDLKAMARGAPVKNEEEVIFASDGHREILETVKTPIRRSDGQLMGVLGIGRDITVYKETERERLENVKFFQKLDRITRAIYKSQDLKEALYNILDEMIPIFHCHRAFFVYPCDPESPVVSIPYHRSLPTVPGMEVLEKEVPMPPAIAETYRTMLNERSLYIRDEPDAGNEKVWEELKIGALMQMPLFPRKGKPWVFGIHHCGEGREWTAGEKNLMVEIGRRITDSLTNLLLHEDIQQKESFLSNIFENIPNMIFIKNASDLRFIRINRAGEELTGIGAEEMIGKNDYDFFPPEEAVFFSSKDREVLEKGDLVDIPQETIQTRERGRRILHTKKIPIRDSRGNPEFLLGISEDITDRMERERRLRETQEWLNAFMTSTGDAITIYDEEGRIVLINPRALELYPVDMDRSKIIGSRIFDYEEYYPKTGKGFLQYYRLVRETGKTQIFDQEYNQDGRSIFFSHRIFPVGKGIGIISSDITEKKKLEDQLHQVQKIESIGRLAGGVAHDFNNILGIIIGYTEMALASEAKDAEHDSYLREIMDAADRSSALTRQLLAFARKQNVSPRTLDLNKTVENMLKMLGSLIGEDTELVWRGSEGLWPVYIDPNQVDQILANLCVNARDAMDDSGGITIETFNQQIDRTYCEFHPEMEPGDYVVLSVTDNGRGMSGETLSRIFEPFFTTKSMGKGTGLGLSTVYGIVRQNRGNIRVYSEPGVGSTFKIFLPRDGKSPEALEVPQKREEVGGHERLLVIEDEAVLLKMTAAMLRNQGYRVFEAGTKEEALSVIEEQEGRIDLILSDIIMPDMNGKELTDLIRRDFPDIKCLFMSGYTDEIIARQGILEEGIRFIQKPFSGDGLAGMIRTILEED